MDPGRSQHLCRINDNSGRHGGAGTDNAAPPNPCIVTLGATFDVHFHNETLGSLAGAGSVLLSDPTLTVGADNTSTTFSGSISGSGNLTKIGTGTFTLSGANTYTGQTSVLGGTLQVTGSLSPSTTVSVAPGAMLTGTATIANETVTGTNGNNTFVIDTTGITLNGNPIVSTPYGLLTLNGGGSSNTFDVLGTNSGSTTVLNAGSGSDMFNVGSAPNFLPAIQGSVTVNGQGGNDSLNYNDHGSPGTGQVQYTIAGNSVKRSGAAAVTYAGVSSVSFQARNSASNGSGNGNFVGVDSTAAGASYSVNAGTGYNQFIVFQTGYTLNGIQGGARSERLGYRQQQPRPTHRQGSRGPRVPAHCRHRALVRYGPALCRCGDADPGPGADYLQRHEQRVRDRYVGRPAYR